MDYNFAASLLGEYGEILRQVEPSIQETVCDIRLCVHQPVSLCCAGKTYFLDTAGRAYANPRWANTVVKPEELEEIVMRLCGYSMYSHVEELKNGYISVEKKLRVGVGGTAVLENGALRTVRDISSVSIRIPREVIGCADHVFQKQVSLTKGVLIAGAPSTGKTTLLRDLARQVSMQGNRVTVLDERYELFAGGFDLGPCTDVLQGYPKADGIVHAIRCLSPSFIFCDEIADADLPAIQKAAAAGVAFVATVHVGTERELMRRPLCRQLLKTGVFHTVVLLTSREHPAQMATILKVGEEIADDVSVAAADPHGRHGDFLVPAVKGQNSSAVRVL